MTVNELKSQNEYLRDKNTELSEQIAELKSELLLLKSENQSELEPRFYFNKIIDDYAGDDNVDRLAEVVDYLVGYIKNHDGYEEMDNGGLGGLFGL